MSFEKFLFYLFAALLIFSASMVISRKNPVHAVLFLVLAFFNCAGLWMLASAEFLAIVLVLVYVGAVMVLFLFAIMMLDIDVETMRAGFVKMLPAAIGVGAMIAIELILIIGSGKFGLDSIPAPEAKSADYSNTAELGRALFEQNIYAFEIAAVILLVAIIAAIELTLRRRPKTRYQDPGKQIRVKAKDRLRVIKVESEEKYQ